MKGVYYLFGLLALFGVVFAAAAALPVEGGVLQAGLDDDLTCDADGVVVTAWIYENDDLTVTGVRIGDIDAACNGLEIHVDVYDGSGTHLGGVSTTVSGADPQTFNFGASIDATQIEELHVGITT